VDPTYRGGIHEAKMNGRKLESQRRKGTKPLHWTLHTEGGYANFILHKCNTHNPHSRDTKIETKTEECSGGAGILNDCR
jgi:hypothetical protein